MLWRRIVTLGGPGPRAVPACHRAAAPLRPRAPVAVHFDNASVFKSFQHNDFIVENKTQ